jgi:hypothetical protein
MKEMTQNTAEKILAARAFCKLEGATDDSANETFTTYECQCLLAMMFDNKYFKAVQKYTHMFDAWGTPTDTEAEKLLDEASVMVKVLH